MFAVSFVFDFRSVSLVCLCQIKAHIWVDRVPTKENISDLPSREEYSLVRKLGASYVEPVMDDAFWSPDAWKTLSLKGMKSFVRKGYLGGS